MRYLENKPNPSSENGDNKFSAFQGRKKRYQVPVKSETVVVRKRAAYIFSHSDKESWIYRRKKRKIL